MLSDGTSTYTYNYANRLTSVNGTDVSSFVYNGLGDRYQQMVNGATTTYQLDLAGSLVQVLADGQQSYVYGLETFKQGGRTVVSQVSETQTGYYLPDVMGSVRQMTSEEGELQLAQSYSPYGEELEEIGSEPATFGYAGQLYDEQTGLLFLRARYYSPSAGRFISHDTWEGDENMPMSYNMWLYGYGNPMRYTDPSGNFALLDTLFAGVVGAAAGVLVGATIGTCTYDKALTGQCGCDWKLKAFSMTRQQWSEEFMIGGAIAGALFGAATTLPSITLTGFALIGVGITKIAIGGFIIAISIPEVIDAYNRIEDVGANWCSVGRFIYALFQLAGGIALVGSGIVDFAVGTSQVIGASSSSTSATSSTTNSSNTGTNSNTTVNSNGPPYTKSTLQLGQQMHRVYKVNDANGITKIKEFPLPSGKRIDFIDFTTKTIYELKPNNPRQIKAGLKQLAGYLAEVQRIHGPGWSTVLDTY
jgi:RHS repeat-associated protein